MEHFPITLILLLAVWLNGGTVIAAELPADAWTKLPPHPRLFANPARWEKLKADIASDPVAKQLYALVQARAEGVLTQPSLELAKMGDHLFGPMRQIQGRIASLAMVYRVSGDPRFLARARVEMAELAVTPQWRPGHFLSTTEATLAMAIGLDWLYDVLTPTEREQFANAIVEKGLRPSLDEKANSNWWQSGGNWGAVCNGGMAVGALAVAEREPELARLIVNRSITNISFAAAKYAPVGAMSEGPGYGAYPIGSGIAEGTCRNLVEDRMDCTGMHWRLPGARAMLKTRAIYLNGEWDDFVEYRIQREQKALYQTAL